MVPLRRASRSLSRLSRSPTRPPPTGPTIPTWICANWTSDTCQTSHRSELHSLPYCSEALRARDFPHPINERGIPTTQPIICTFNSYDKFSQWNQLSLCLKTSKDSSKPREEFSYPRFCADYEGLGYCVTHGILNASEYGVPQRRSRLFIIGSRVTRPKLPSPITDEPPTVAEALLDLPHLQNGASIPSTGYRTRARSDYSRRMRTNSKTSTNNLVTRNARYVIERYKHIPPGGNWRDIPEYLMKNYSDRTRCHDGIYHRLCWNTPSIVIGNYRKNMLIHPSADRGLSVREAARIQSFPDTYIFTGSIGFQQQQVANAVPPMLAQAVFEQIQ